VRLNRTWLAAIVVAAIGIHAVPFLLYAPGDVYGFVRPWYRELLAHGFSHPFGDYSPPYLYLLWLLTFFDGLLWQVVLIKLLSVAGLLWLVFALGRLFQSLGKPPELSLLALLLPSWILDTSLLGQADSFWVAPCVLATGAAIKGKFVRVAAWAGLAFAFKAQAAFFAPFVIYLFVSERVPAWKWTVAPAIFVLTMVPAWLGGWQAAYIASIYLNQAEWVDRTHRLFVGDSASWWTSFSYLAPQSAYQMRWLGIPSAIAGLALYWWLLPRPTPRVIVLAATLSASAVPFLLPLMHERFFMLAGTLAFAYAVAFSSKRTIGAAVAMEVASAMPIFVWAFRAQPWDGTASIFALLAILMLLWELRELSGSRQEISTDERAWASAS
jgi:Gpi18-like mannosyltransferase